MATFEITGGTALCGTVAASGAKNAALPMMAAAILGSEPVCLEGVPRLTDVQTLSRLLGHLGMEVLQTDSDLRIKTVDPTPIGAPYSMVRRMRASFCVLGPLLARRGRAIVPLPGGCNIGDRPVELHLKGLAALGARLRLDRGCVAARAGRLVGATVDLGGPRGPTVTGTANVLSAAVLAKGTTIITGAACEPEIVDLGRLLIAMGARITGLGTSTIRIEGVDQLGGAVHRIIPDRIEAATLMLAAAITRGSITVTGIVPEHLTAVLEMLRAAGVRIEPSNDRVAISAHAPLRPVDVVAQPHPGLPTDVQAQATAMLSLASGRSVVRDTVFPSRLLHVAELRRLGAKIELHDSAVVVTGAQRLVGTAVTACDLRASAALVLAGLAAEGTTRVECIQHLDRGYERLDRKLRQLGARIERLAGSECDATASELKL
jgi:UDP-N-acetylglucosamine 1-carboxyvinyltransferase